MKVTLIILFFLLTASRVSYGQTSNGNTYPLVIQFSSFCCGVPKDSTVRAYVNRFKKSYKIKAIKAYKVGPMGREGEYNLAFPLTEMSKKQAKKFVEGIKSVKIAPGDQGAIHYQSDFVIENTSAARSVLSKDNLVKF